MSTLKPPPVYVVSGGKGLAGDHLVQSLLVQYPGNNVPVIIIPDVHTVEKIEEIVKEACRTGGIITHTMVNPVLREKMQELAKKCGVKSVDFMGELADFLNSQLQVEPMVKPGLYRTIKQEYFNRIEAIEFTLSTDDGRNAHKLKEAEIILTGVSRTGKTPLSVYLAIYGWKVANVPIIKDMEPPEELFKADNKHVFGLNINPKQLQMHREKRMQNIGRSNMTPYTDTLIIEDEIEYARKIFKRGKFNVINVTGKPIETTANEIIRLMPGEYDVKTRLRRELNEL